MLLCGFIFGLSDAHVAHDQHFTTPWSPQNQKNDVKVTAKGGTGSVGQITGSSGLNVSVTDGKPNLVTGPDTLKTLAVEGGAEKCVVVKEVVGKSLESTGDKWGKGETGKKISEAEDLDVSPLLTLIHVFVFFSVH